MLAVTPIDTATPPARNSLVGLSSASQMLYQALRKVADEVSCQRGYCAAVSQVHFFCPGEVVADALCIARSTMYRKLSELKAAELVEARAHYVTYKGRTVADGMVWAVKMHPERSRPVKVPYDALKKSYRCLSADIAAGRTAFRQTGQSKKTPTKQVDIQKILAWALPPSTTQIPDKGLTVRSDLEAVLDVPFVDKEARSAAVDGAARALAMSLSDPGGLMFYRWLLWQLLRLSDRHQGDYWHQVYEQARRARADAAEGFARRPGALFVSRLRRAGWWSEVMNAPPTRVGARPARAEWIK
jgi:hypothetical protein